MTEMNAFAPPHPFGGVIHKALWGKNQTPNLRV